MACHTVGLRAGEARQHCARHISFTMAVRRVGDVGLLPGGGHTHSAVLLVRGDQIDRPSIVIPIQLRQQTTVCLEQRPLNASLQFTDHLSFAVEASGNCLSQRAQCRNSIQRIVGVGAKKRHDHVPDD
ncbi:hypothetical protein [Pseudomonas floridensis]|uniref:hypothetical protein n=1 Tax=Pseudomonas floridensis TaxID=1958950 RepID=UPI001FC98762|nr:hypothetical protein [Pseudomonas floridensis]